LLEDLKREYFSFKTDAEDKINKQGKRLSESDSILNKTKKALA